MDVENVACGQLERDMPIPDAVVSLPDAWHRSAGTKHAYPPHSSVTQQDLIAQNPFRTPEVLERAKATRLRAMKESARGPKLLSVDFKVYIWLSQWLFLLLLYHSTSLGPSLRAVLASGWVYSASGGPATAWTMDHVQALALLLVLPTFAVVYRRLYGSDPGFLGTDSDAKHLQMDQAFAFACPYCGSRPTNRSKHSKVSGQCVHKFDHSCWVLSTDIGDRNHGTFWMYLVLQVGLIVWALNLQLQTMSACWGSLQAGSDMRECGLYGAPHAAALAASVLICFGAFFLFMYLLALHTYLLATNQTTYEVIKGAKLGYLAPHFQHRSACACRYRLPDDLHILWWHELTGRGPPKPFSEGAVRNIWAQLSTSWPREYVAAPL